MPPLSVVAPAWPFASQSFARLEKELTPKWCKLRINCLLFAKARMKYSLAYKGGLRLQTDPTLTFGHTQH